MAAPTWRNVNAPDFSGSMEGIRTAGTFLDRAFTNARGLVDGVDQFKTDRTEADFMAELQKYKSAEELQAALSNDPTLGMDRRRLDANALKSGSGMVDTLLGRETERATQQKTQLENTGKANELAYAPLLNQLAQVAQLEGRPGVTRMLKENPGLVKALKFNDGLDSALGVAETNVEVDGKIQDQGIDMVNFQDGQFDRKVVQGAASAAQTIRENYATTDGAREALTAIEDPMLRAATATLLQRDFPELYGDAMSSLMGEASGGSSGGGAGGTGGGDAASVMNYEARAVGFNSVPESVKTLGQASEFARQVNKAGASSSAMGLYQITGDTMRDFGPKVFKGKWAETPWNLETQDKLAEAIFKSTGGSPDALKGRWTSLAKLSPAELSKLAKSPWSQARQTIARLESNGNPDELFASGPTLANSAAVRNAEDENVTGASAFMQRLGQNPPPKAAADMLVKEGYYTDSAKVEGVLRDIMARGGGKISAASAADILSRAPERDIDDYAASTDVLGGIFNLKGGFEQFIDEEVSLYKSDAKLRNANRQTDRVVGVETIQAAEKLYTGARSELEMLRKSGRANASELARAERKVADAAETVRGIRSKANKEGNLSPTPGTKDEKKVITQRSQGSPNFSDRAAKLWDDVSSGSFFNFQ